MEASGITCVVRSTSMGQSMPTPTAGTGSSRTTTPPTDRSTWVFSTYSLTENRTGNRQAPAQTPLRVPRWPSASSNVQRADHMRQRSRAKTTSSLMGLQKSTFTTAFTTRAPCWPKEAQTMTTSSCHSQAMRLAWQQLSRYRFFAPLSFDTKCP